VEEELSAQASGASDVRYHGNPHVHQLQLGRSSSVKKVTKVTLDLD
jgi:hypothetical protein